MELVTLDGYTEDEKVEIGRDHLLPRQLDRAGLEPDDVTFADDALRRLAPSTPGRPASAVWSAHRPGAAQGRPRRWRWTTHVAGDDRTADNLVDVPRAGRTTPRRLRNARRCPVSRPVWPSPAPAATSSSSRPRWPTPESGASGLTLTGQLGDVMKESAQIALSYLRRHGAELELPVADLKERGIHVHVPAGRDPEGRPERGRHDDDGAGVAAVRAPGPVGRGDDR